MANPFQDPESMLRELRQQAAELETRATRLRDDLAAASATVTSPDGAVTVTLSPTGALQYISFTAKAAAHKPEALGPLVMKTVRAAQGEVSNRVAASLAEQFGDPETMDFITQFMPAPEEPKRSRDEELDGEEFDGNVLRKRQGRVPQDPRTRRPDEGGSLLR